MASLVMPNSDSRDKFFNPTLTLVIDSYTIHSQECMIAKLATRLATCTIKIFIALL